MSSDPPDFDGDYGGVDSLRHARSDVHRWMMGRGDGVDASEQAVLIVSELASNAVQASADGTYNVRVATVDSNSLDISVGNTRVAGFAPPPGASPLVGPLAPSGRGLAIVRLIAQRVSVHVTDDEVRVSARLSARTHR